MGTGNIVHNLSGHGLGQSRLRAVRLVREVPGRDQATRSPRTSRERAADFARLGDDARRAAPTPEHFWPLLYVLGARLPGDAVRLVNDRIEHGSLGMTSVVFEEAATARAAA